MAKFLVTGGAGFIGSNFTKRVIDLGHEVLIIDNLCTGQREKIDPRADFHEVDLCDYEKMHPLFEGIDYVHHFAALPRVPMSIDKPRETTRNNVESTINVLMAARDAKVRRVVYSASSSAYGNQTQMPLKETMATAPISPYAVQKYVGEHFIRTFYEIFGLEGVSLRYFNIYGPGMAFEGAYTPAVAACLQAIQENRAFTIYGDGSITRDFTYVNDVIDANLRAATSPNVGKGEVINIGAGDNQSINRVADLVGGERVYAEPRKGDPQNTLADISKAKELLGWEPKVTFEEGIRRVKEIYLK